MPEEVLEQEQQAESTAQAEATEQPAASATAEGETRPDPSAEGGEKPPERKGGVQRRIDELTKKARLAEARAEALEQLLLKQGGAPADKSATPADAKPAQKPNAADFDDTEKYLDARDEWVRQDTLKAAREEFQKAEQQREQRSEQEVLADEWGEKEAAFTEKHTDYEDVTAEAMEALQSVKGPGQAAIAHAIQYAEAGPELLYYLGQHPDEMKKLAGLHPTQAVIALGRIEARLVAETTDGAEKAPPRTQKPKPPTPIKGTGRVDDGELRDDLPTDEWRRRFLKKQERARE